MARAREPARDHTLFNASTDGPSREPGSEEFGRPSPGLLGGRRRELFGSVDDGTGELGRASVLAAGTAVKQRERVGQFKPEPFGQYALGVLDEDPAVQCVLELFGQRRGEARRRD
jgi:hypothetical protein